MAPTLAFQIVGSYYRPPAGSILAVIPIGTPLSLRAEPTNPVDPNAIAVWIETVDIPQTEAARKALMLAGADCGFRLGSDNQAESPEDFLEFILFHDEWHLGYIPATIAKTPTARELISHGPVPGRLIILDSKAHIQIGKSGAPS